MILNKKGFSAVEALIIVLVLAIVGFGGWYVWSKRHTKTQQANSTQQTTNNTDTKDTQELSSYTIENEGLTFQYDPQTTTVKSAARQPQNEDDTYVVNTNITMGKVTVGITTGIDGIGGGPSCMIADRDTCEVVDTKDGSYLGKPVTYRLIKAVQATECGYDGVPACDKVDLTTKYFLDTYDGNDKTVFGPCCSTVNSEAKNVGKKAKIAGSVLVNIDADKAIQDANMLKNADILEAIKLVSSLHY